MKPNSKIQLIFLVCLLSFFLSFFSFLSFFLFFFWCGFSFSFFMHLSVFSSLLFLIFLTKTDSRTRMQDYKDSNVKIKLQGLKCKSPNLKIEIIQKKNGMLNLCQCCLCKQILNLTPKKFSSRCVATPVQP